MMVAAMAMLSCMKETMSCHSGMEEMVFSATYSDSRTRTVLTDGVQIYWLPGDRISVCGAQEPFECTAQEPSAVTEFRGFAPDSRIYYAFYPYQSALQWNGAEVTFTIPSVQAAVNGSFGDDLNASAAYVEAGSELLLRFRNLLGYVKFTVPEGVDNVVSLTVETLASEALSGTAVADCSAESPVAVPSTDAQSSVSLVSDEPLATGDYYIAMIPGTYSEGLSFCFTDDSGRTATRTIARELSLSPGQVRNIGPLSGLSFDDPYAGPPADEIWYVSVSGDVAEPNDPTAFNAEIISNTYEDGKGIIRFASDLTRIGKYAFDGCTDIVSISLPSALESVGSFAFRDMDRLRIVNCYSVLPPSKYGNASSWKPLNAGTLIRVPDACVADYEASEEWKSYPVLGFSDETYVSSDYSKDGEVTVLQEASAGKGIDIVFMGDAYSDRQISAGDYDADISRAMEMFFGEEPYTTFREYFNVYSIKAVSPCEGYVNDAAVFGTWFGEGTKVGGNNDLVTRYAAEAVGDERVNQAVVIVMMNREYYAGTCYMYFLSLSDYGNGLSISYFPLGTDDDTLARLIRHEAGGHGFAKLADEYKLEANGAISSSLVTRYQGEQADFGWWKNVDFTADPETVRWKHFLTDGRYQYDGLGVYEGGFRFMSGVWRPTETSIMNDSSKGFNAPSREAIYYRIHKLAYGSEWVYDYEDFVEYDAVNRASSMSGSAITMTRQANYVERTYEPTAPPVVLGYLR